MRTIPAILVAAGLAAPACASPQADVAALAWLAGQWRETRGEVTTTETWSRDESGALSGVGETVRAGRPPRVERMSITAGPAGATFTALIPGQPPTPFVRLPGPAGDAVFENRAHDFPQRVIYRRCGADLCARIEGTIAGAPKSQDWRYVRVK